MSFDVPSWTLAAVVPERAVAGIRDEAREDRAWSRHGDLHLRTLDAADAGLRLVSVRVPDALALDAPSLADACARAYALLATELDGERSLEPVRLWNFIPRILEPLGDQPHRYMVFNAGRYRALRSQLGAAFDRRIATASGVGHQGRDLSIHCLAAARGGEPVENPRQIPAYRYSARWGPKPPCFARATRCELEAPLLLVGGTASVVGEESLHQGDLEAQLHETLRNLATVVHVGVLNGHRQVDAPLPGDDELWPQLARFRNLRVYHPRRGDRECLRRALLEQLGDTVELELLEADLCRPELLVEIEGVAELAPRVRRLVAWLDPRRRRAVRLG
ncbi:MAG: hypothetical protein AAGC60_17970 [Acidobacteriota bacterium]